MLNSPLSPLEPAPLRGPLAEPWSLGKIVRLLGMFGPAAILASVSIGAGETIVVVRTGAWMGYGLLWLILLAALTKGVCVTYFLGRYTAVSGESPGQRLVKLPGPRGWLLFLLIALELGAAGPLWGALARPSGELMSYLLLGAGDHGNANRIIATIFIGIALLLSLPTSYRFLERQQVFICGILVGGTLIGTLLVRPDWWAALLGTFSIGHIPSVPSTAPTLFRDSVWPLIAVTMGYVGGSVMTYLVYPDLIALHGWGMTGHPRRKELLRRAAAGTPADYLPTDPQQVRQIRRAAGPVRWDVAFGAFVLFVVSAAFMVAGAAVLYPRQAAGEDIARFDGWGLLTDQSEIWSAIHPSLVWVYYLCVVAALWGTLQSYPDVYARGVTEYFRAIWPQRSWSQQRIQLAVCAYVFAAACAVIWSPMDFDAMTQTVNFLATSLGVCIAMFAGLYLNFQLPPVYRTRRWMLGCGILSAIILTGVSSIAGWGLWRTVME
jgi:Mn2+/Fe2+ NRAMP family transporter